MNLNFPDKYLDNIVNMLVAIGKKEIDCTFSKIDVDDYGTLDIEFNYTGDCSDLEELSKIISKTQEECKYPFNTLQNKINELSSQLDNLSPTRDIPKHWYPIVKDMEKEIKEYVYSNPEFDEILLLKSYCNSGTLYVAYTLRGHEITGSFTTHKCEEIDRIILKYRDKLWELDNND